MTLLVNHTMRDLNEDKGKSANIFKNHYENAMQCKLVYGNENAMQLSYEMERTSVTNPSY